MKRNQPRYPRTARLNELVREIVAEELGALDDERLEGVAVTSVVVDADIRRATVYFDHRAGQEADDEVVAVLGEHRVRPQAAVGRQARMRRTPELVFRPDDVQRRAGRVEDILRDLGDRDATDPDPGLDT